MNPEVSRRRKQRVNVPRLYAPQPKVPRDQHGLHQAACTDLADELGYKPGQVFSYWGQAALEIEFHTGFPRAMCEYYALECVRYLFDLRGRAAD